MAEASGFDLSKLPPALRSVEIVETKTYIPDEIARAYSFEPGQASGPFGPKFVGYGEPRKVPLGRYVAEWTALLFLGSLVVMALR